MGRISPLGCAATWCSGLPCFNPAYVTSRSTVSEGNRWRSCRGEAGLDLFGIMGVTWTHIPVVSWHAPFV